MACACQGRRKATFTWTSPADDEGNTTTMTYTTEMQAKAKVLRAGGSYKRNG